MTDNVGVIIASAGSGTRMSSSVPKQYIKVLKKPLFVYSVEAFQSLGYVKKLVLVADDVEKMKTCLEEHELYDGDRMSIIQGGLTRHRSIKRGLEELKKFQKELDLKVVIVHDGVRPFIPKLLVDELISESLAVGAAGPTRPLVSTIVKPNAENQLEESLDRNLYANSETPQSFNFDVLDAAYSKASDEDLDVGTECLQLVLKYCGVHARLVPTNHDLWKVTYSRDIYAVESIMKEKMTDVCLITDEDSEVVQMLASSLVARVESLKTFAGSPPCRIKENGKTYNSIVIFHDNEIQQEQYLMDFGNLIDLDRDGLIVHIIDHATIDGLQKMSVYNLQRNSRKMAHHYQKLRKGVVVIHRISSNEIQKLTSMVTYLILNDTQTFSGQTLFL